MNTSASVARELYESTFGHGDRVLPKAQIRRMNLLGELWALRSSSAMAKHPKATALDLKSLLPSIKRTQGRISDLISELGGLDSAW